MDKKHFDKKVNTSKLRECQSKAHATILEHFSDDNAEKHILVQMPTGTGKSALIAIMPFGLSEKKVLILAPNLTLAKQLEDDLDYTRNPDTNVYKKRGIFTDDEMEGLEVYTLRLESSANAGDIENHQIIIANYQQLSDIEKWFKDRKDMIDVIIIDEAHHQKANTYQEVISFFTGAKIIGLTATPFRSDGKKVDGKNIYTYHFRDAIKQGYIRNILVSNVTPQEIELSFSDEKSKRYTLEEIVKMKEEAWFRQGIALSQDCCDSIARKAVEKLRQLEKDFPNSSHQIIASAMSIRHGREFVKPAFEKLGLKVGLVSSEDTTTNKATLEKLRQGKIDVIISVGMLGEGFDHNKLGVAAIFRPYATLNPYIQFIGRAIRANDNCKHCYVVSHLGLNQSKRFEEFKLFDSEDKEFLETLFVDEDKRGGIVDLENDAFIEETPLYEKTSEQDAVKITEVGSEVLDFQNQFVSSDEKIAQVVKTIQNLTDKERDVLFRGMGISYDAVSSKKKLKNRPVDERRAAKSLLNEKEKSVVMDIMKELGVKFGGRNFNKMRTNFVWIKQKVSRLTNEKIGCSVNDRNNLSLKQIEDFISAGDLEKIKEECTAYYRDKLSAR